MEEEIGWDILIENELWKILEFSETEEQKEKDIEEFCEGYGIPVYFAKNKIAKMEEKRKKRQEEDVER